MSDPLLYIRQLAFRNGPSIADTNLLTRFVKDRDDTALTALIVRHGPMVWSVCRRMLNHHDAEDAFQATFLVFVRRATSIASPHKLANWIYGVAYQTAIKARATAAKRQRRECSVARYPEMPGRNGDSRILMADVLHHLDEEVSRLPSRYRTVIVLCDLCSKSRREVASQLGYPEGTIAGWLARARSMLSKRLQQRGLEAPALTTVLAVTSITAQVPDSVIRHTIQVLTSQTITIAGSTMAISDTVRSLSGGVLNAMTYQTYAKAFAVGLLVTVTGFGGVNWLYGSPADDTRPMGEKSHQQVQRSPNQPNQPPSPRESRNVQSDGDVIQEQNKRLQTIEAQRQIEQDREIQALRDSLQQALAERDQAKVVALTAEQNARRKSNVSGNLSFSTKNNQLVAYAVTFDARYEIMADQINYDDGKQRIMANSAGPGNVQIVIQPNPLARSSERAIPKIIRCDKLIFDWAGNSLEIAVGNQSIGLQLNEAFFENIRKTPKQNASKITDSPRPIADTKPSVTSSISPIPESRISQDVSRHAKSESSNSVAMKTVKLKSAGTAEEIERIAGEFQKKIRLSPACVIAASKSTNLLFVQASSALELIEVVKLIELIDQALLEEQKHPKK